MILKTIIREIIIYPLNNKFSKQYKFFVIEKDCPTTINMMKEYGKQHRQAIKTSIFVFIHRYIKSHGEYSRPLFLLNCDNGTKHMQTFNTTDTNAINVHWPH